jgi:spore germination cell wall hydrolase CwlJ-like protein
MTHADYFMTSLCLFREAAGEGREGQIAVAWNIVNRTNKRHSTPYAEVVRPWQFSSITAPGDVTLTKYGSETDATWQQCQLLAADVLEGQIADPTSGSTLYYNPNGIKTTSTISLPDGRIIPFPSTWNAAKVEFVIQIGKHFFWKEV